MYFSVNWQSFVRRHWKANLSRATMERSRRGVLLGAAPLKYLIVISSREVQDPCSARNWIIPFRRQQQRIPLTVARLGRGVDWLIRGSIRSGKPRKCPRQCEDMCDSNVLDVYCVRGCPIVGGVLGWWIMVVAHWAHGDGIRSLTESINSSGGSLF